MPATSNTEEVILEHVGKRLVGVMFGELRPGLQGHNRVTLVFEDGSGLAWGDRGTFWSVDRKAIRQGIAHREKELGEARTQQERVVSMATALEIEPPETRRSKKPNKGRTKAKS